MSSLLRNRRRTKIITPSNSSFSNCVEGHLFIQPARKPLETFKPVVYLDEQGRRHGRVSDHLLQRQIENDRDRLKKQPIPKVSVSSTLYGIRNPNIAALVRDVPIDNYNEDDDDDEKFQADDEIKFIEYKKSAKPASKSSNRQSTGGKQSVKFDTTPSVNMARLVESHLTEIDDVDDDDDETSEIDDDDEELESSKHQSELDSSSPNKTTNLSETLSTSKDENDGLTTNSTLDYNRQSEEKYLPPTVEDIHDTESERKIEESLPDMVQQSPSEETSSPQQQQQRLKSAASSSSRPKTAPSTRSRSATDQRPSSSSSSSTSSDDTSALLRSDNDDSLNVSDDEANNDEVQILPATPVKSQRTISNVDETMNTINEEPVSPQPSDKLQEQRQKRDMKGEYDVNQVIQLKESFQPIINEAASYGHLDIVRKLIECGQSVHTQNFLQRTPLHEACVSGNAELVSELLTNGALSDQRDSQGMTALHVAASHGTLKCVRILCEKGCDINAQDNLGQTAAHYSAMHNHVDVLKYLTNIKHIDLNIANNETKYPIHYAGKYGSQNVLKFFLQSNLTIYAKDRYGNIITHEASEYNQFESIKLIWKVNRNLFALKNNNGRTPMHTAALFGSVDVLHWFLEMNIIDIDQTDNDGYTMAHLAASRGHAECFSCLISHGAQLEVYTFDKHESVLNIARRSGKFNRIEQARAGTLRCRCCQEKSAKEKHDKAHARNAVEQLIHTQIQRGYHLNIPVNRSLTNLSMRNRSTT